jgi:hypothetical protein
MKKKISMASLKAAGYSLMNPPVPASDYYPTYLILKAKCATKTKAEKAKAREKKKASRDTLTPEEMALIREKRRAKRQRYRDNMTARYSKKSALHAIPKEAKASGKTVAQLIIESWSRTCDQPPP